MLFRVFKQRYAVVIEEPAIPYILNYLTVKNEIWCYCEWGHVTPYLKNIYLFLMRVTF